MKHFFYRITHPIFQIYWRLRKPETFGVKAIIVRSGTPESMLLIRNSYGNTVRWNLCGGGYNPRKESPSTAVMREIREELSVDSHVIQILGEFKNEAEGKKDSVVIFLVEIDEAQIIKGGSELCDARWFTLSEINPQLVTAKIVREAVVLYTAYLNNQAGG